MVSAGTGPSPLQIEGKAFLSGRYRGAPVSLSVITSGVAGPFDLGNVVVRVPLFVDPETAQIHAVSDPIPDVFGGAKLDIRSVFVNVNRKEFTLNGTNCSQIRDRRQFSAVAAATRPTRRPSRPSRSRRPSRRATANRCGSGPNCTCGCSARPNGPSTHGCGRR